MESKWNYFSTLDDDQKTLLLLFQTEKEVTDNKFIQAVCAEANARYKTKNGGNLFSYKFKDPCLVPPNDNKLKKDIETLINMGYLSSEIVRDPTSLQLNVPRLTNVYALTSEAKFKLYFMKFDKREKKAQRLFKGILNESRESWQDAVVRYQSNFLEYSKNVNTTLI